MGEFEHLELTSNEREELWKEVIDQTENYRDHVNDLQVKTELTSVEADRLLHSFSFEKPCDSKEVIKFVTQGLEKYRAHSSHSRYFGLFDPRPTTMGIFADAIVAAYNPQLASWNHGSFPIAIENHVIKKLAGLIGWDMHVDGTFTTGGAEANHTAILAALNFKFPDIKALGLRALPSQPLIYVTKETHHSVSKAASACGLGANACVAIPLNEDLKMDPSALSAQIAKDFSQGHAPFLVVGTIGTTNGGMIDPLSEISKIAKENKLWLHLDGAWGGSAILVPALRPYLKGIETADSVSIDAHKWMSVPMGAGIFITRHTKILNQTFNVSTNYMPPKKGGLEETDPYMHSLQWSRRFIGLKVFMSLAVAGFEGYKHAIGNQARLGELLRSRLIENGWYVVNKTPLPVICFTDMAQAPSEHIFNLLGQTLAKNAVWISSTRLGHHHVLRACISNYKTSEADVEFLVQELG